MKAKAIYDIHTTLFISIFKALNIFCND